MQSMNKRMLEFLRKQHPLGSRIRLGEMTDPCPVEPGTMGTLEAIDDLGTYHVRWDNGRGLGLIPGEDSFTVLPPEPTMLRLYMPLTADLYEEGEYGLEEESSVLEGEELVGYTGAILAALEREKHICPEEQERGIMHWYGEADSLNAKVRSAVFALEERDGQLWGVAKCRVLGNLSPEELSGLKNFIRGQASDGFGESFEQRDIEVDEGILNVHLWNSDDWSIQIEEECFGQQQKMIGGMNFV